MTDTPSPEPAVLDVHPPHHAAQSWRDFLIHIATITIGLLIAIGLEQTVEYIHHRHQLAEMEDSLRAEGIENRATAVADIRVADAAIATASAAIAQLQAARTGAVAAAPEINLGVPGDSAWSAARDIGLLALAPHALVDNGWKVHFIQEAVTAQVRKVYADLDGIQALASIHPDIAALAPADREALLVAYANYRESLKVLKIDAALLDRATGLALDGTTIETGSLYKN